jgi:RimJ/RimL family protein N-acetyltransferase
MTMEMMSYHPELDGESRCASWTIGAPTFGPRSAAVTITNWRAGLPALEGARLTLRELRVEDASALFEQMTTEEVSRFISPPPASVEGFEQFIRWTHRERAAGRHACFAVVPEGQAAPVGMFQIRVLDREQRTAEWGFALGSAYWGTGLYLASARLVIDFAFGQMGMRRLEARACVINGRGTGALLKVGAVREAVLHESFERYGERLDQGLWTIHRDHWLSTVTEPGVTLH